MNGTRFKQLGYFGKSAGNKINSTRADRLRCNPSGKKRPETEFPLIPFINGNRIADTHQLD
jgi:hypothetical protein